MVLSKTRNGYLGKFRVVTPRKKHETLEQVIRKIHGENADHAVYMHNLYFGDRLLQEKVGI